MCGIAGHVVFGSTPDVDILARMLERLRSRGPDDTGVFVDGPVALGATRLSIIDPSGGHQPMPNENGTIWTAHNGEIYNFTDLRTELETRHHRFRTRCDTEVIVHAYEEWGLDFPRRLRGMFGLAIWDQGCQRLVLARDPLGIKPLYYTEPTNKVAFASEIKALLEDPTVGRDHDLFALDLYFSLGYIPVPWTVYAAIRQLPPAHMLVAEPGGVRVFRYWDVPDPMTRPHYTDEVEASAALRQEFTQVVRSHLVSDVPLGVLLSGGLDSTIVLMLAAEATDRPVKTFSVGFREESYSELDYAEIAALRYATDHYPLVVTPNVCDLLPKLVAYFDEPFADSSAIPLYMIAQHARQQVKVVLTGDGGDELFAGYETYLATELAAAYDGLPPFVRRFVEAGIRRLPVSHDKVPWRLKARRFVEGASRDANRAHLAWREVLSPSKKAALYADEFRAALGVTVGLGVFQDDFARADRFDGVNRLCYFDAATYLPNDMLVKVDRMTMVHSLEARVPFLDHGFVELAFAIPGRMKRRGLVGKRILRRAFEGLLPPEIAVRRKAGFNVPIASWLAGPLRDMTHELLLENAALKGWFDLSRLGGLVTEHETRVCDNSHELWALLVFALWLSGDSR